MIKLDMMNIKDVFTDCITNKKEGVFYCLADDDYVFNSESDDYNKEYCDKNNIVLLNLGQMGGTIVTSKGNIGIAIFKFNGFEDGQNLGVKLCEYLKPKLPNLSIDGNDLLIDGKYKVASYSSKHVGNRLILTTMQISINANLDLIKNICLKPMTKIPRGLSEYNITTEEILKFIKNILH